MDMSQNNICCTCSQAQKLTALWILTTASLLSLTSANNQPVSVDVYWNRSNEIFSSNNEDHILQIALKDKIRFHCPHYGGRWSSNADREYYVIYRVPKQYYDSCMLPDRADLSEMSRQIRRVITCNSPDSSKFFSTVLERFSPLPGSHGGLTFQPGVTYYFISVSSGSLEGLNNREALSSSCLQNNMKLQLTVTQPGKPRIYPSTSSMSHDNIHGRQTSTHATSHVRRHNNNVRRQQPIATPTLAAESIFEKTTAPKRQPFPQAVINAGVVLEPSSAPSLSTSMISVTLCLISCLLIT